MAIIYYSYPLLLTTANPLFIDTRYNDKIMYNGNLTGTEPSLNSWHIIWNYDILHDAYALDIRMLESPEIYVLWGPFLHIIPLRLNAAGWYVRKEKWWNFRLSSILKYYRCTGGITNKGRSLPMTPRGRAWQVFLSEKKSGKKIHAPLIIQPDVFYGYCPQLSYTNESVHNRWYYKIYLGDYFLW